MPAAAYVMGVTVDERDWLCDRGQQHTLTGDNLAHHGAGWARGSQGFEGELCYAGDPRFSCVVAGPDLTAVS